LSKKSKDFFFAMKGIFQNKLNIQQLDAKPKKGITIVAMKVRNKIKQQGETHITIEFYGNLNFIPHPISLCF
jgi:hypothetical protein